jgi:hypothetical protein
MWVSLGELYRLWRLHVRYEGEWVGCAACFSLLDAFDHDIREFRTDDSGAFFTGVERLSNLTIQEEELVTIASVQDSDRKSWL